MMLQVAGLTFAALALVQGARAQTPSQFVLQTPPAISSQNMWMTLTVDIDGDGDLDVMGAGTWLHLLRNEGNGVFTDVATTQLPGYLHSVSGLTPFDCDGDGDVDLYVGGHQSASLLRNDGSGTFAFTATPSQGASNTAVAGDLDGDGDLDLAVAPHFLTGGQNRLLINDGTGNFSPGPTFGNAGFATVAVFDLDGDGDLDLFYPSNRKLLRNDGGLVFTDVSAIQLLVPGSLNLLNMGVGDLDGDGDLDFVFNGTPDFVVLHQGNTLVTGPSVPTTQPTDDFELADFDRDGDLDLLRSSSGSPLSLALNDGLAHFTDASSRLPPVTINAQHAHAADLDRDGDPDIVTCHYFTSPSLVLWNRHLHLDADPAIRGQTWTIELWHQPGYAAGDALGRLAIGLARLPAPLLLPGFGELWIDLSVGFLLVEDVIPSATGQHSFAFAIPAAPQLLGIELNVQGLVEAIGVSPRLTALRVVTIQ